MAGSARCDQAASGDEAALEGIHSVASAGAGQASLYLDTDQTDVNLCLLVDEREIAGLDRKALLEAVT